jgi:antitoxin (DNA-binding transcriptional repressor) of toxin-antitoxin stability system
METKAVGVKALRDNLSRYLKEVKTGTRILVLDRDEVVAEIGEPSVRYATPDAAEKLVKEGKLIRPKGEKVRCVEAPVRISPGTAKKILDELRTDSGDAVH